MLIGVTRALGALAQFVPLGPSTTLDPANTAATVTLSNGNLTATANSDTATGAVSRSITSYSVGKYFASVRIITDQSVSALVGMGVANASQSLTGFIGGTANGLGYYDFQGSVFRNNVNFANFHSYHANSVVDSATDLDNKKQWWRVDGGGWNNDILANQNPATNTGGIDISTGAGGPTAPLFFVIDLEQTADSLTVNFGATAYTFAAPAGFGNW